MKQNEAKIRIFEDQRNEMIMKMDRIEDLSAPLLTKIQDPISSGTISEIFKWLELERRNLKEIISSFQVNFES